MYPVYQNPWYSTYYPVRDEMNMNMMSEMEKNQKMMEMMKEHMKMTKEIKQKVEMIDERLKRLENNFKFQKYIKRVKVMRSHLLKNVFEYVLSKWLLFV